jgi:deoxyribose-phosphate aldolase
MVSPERLIAVLDLTTLSGQESAGDIARLCERAAEHRVAAVCVYGEWVADCVRHLDGTDVRIAAVANFPEGADDAGRAGEEAERAVADGADEIDVVIPFRDGPDEWTAVVAAARAATPGTLKVILETGQLGARTAEAAQIALAAGADFLKTSTGKLQPGATLDAARTLIEAGGGFKASGGVRTHADGSAYAELFEQLRGEPVAPHNFRIGASGLLDELLA